MTTQSPLKSALNAYKRANVCVLPPELLAWITSCTPQPVWAGACCCLTRTFLMVACLWKSCTFCDVCDTENYCLFNVDSVSSRWHAGERSWGVRFVGWRLRGVGRWQVGTRPRRSSQSAARPSGLQLSGCLSGVALAVFLLSRAAFCRCLGRLLRFACLPFCTRCHFVVVV